MSAPLRNSRPVVISHLWTDSFGLHHDYSGNFVSLFPLCDTKSCTCTSSSKTLWMHQTSLTIAFLKISQVLMEWTTLKTGGLEDRRKEAHVKISYFLVTCEIAMTTGNLLLITKNWTEGWHRSFEHKLNGSHPYTYRTSKMQMWGNAILRHCHFKWLF